MTDTGVWVYDIETLKNCYTYTAMHRETKEVVQFTIWRDVNEMDEMIEHLSGVRGLIGFNNIGFDYPVLHYILNNHEEWKGLSGDQITTLIYQKAQDTIADEWSSVKEMYVKIPQLDLFRIWHYNNKARMTSLKKLQIALRYKNVQDMPYKHYEDIETIDQVKEILDYNLNDVDSTFDFYIKSLPKLELRKGLYERYGLKCMNYPDSKIGEDLTLKLYCEATGEDMKEVKKRRTHRGVFKFKECFPEYLSFKTPEFNELQEYLSKIEVEELKGSFKYSLEYQGFTFDLGTGGIHGCIKAGVYESNDEYIIVDVDVASYYPILPIILKLFPEHLGKKFLEIYRESFVKPRFIAKGVWDKTRALWEKLGILDYSNEDTKNIDYSGQTFDKTLISGFKLAANSVYGKSNSQYSWLFDPLYTLKTTLGGQLSLMMLSEKIMTNVDDLTILQINTDGLTVRIPRSEKRNFYNQCTEWEEETGLILEYAAYKKMIIRDVNNYIAEDMTGYVKYKGAFKPYDVAIKDEEYHKSLSQAIVPKAVAEYFLNGVPIEETVMKSTDIYDFCKTFNASHGWTCETSDIEYLDTSYEEAVEKLTNKGFIEAHVEGFFIPENGGNMAGVQLEKDGNKTKIYKNIQQRQKTNRYYVSTNGKTFSKSKDVRTIEIEAGGTLVTIFNEYEEKHILDYEIDYDYYIKECYKLVHKVDGTEERELEAARQAKEQIKRDKEEEKFLKYCWNKPPTVRQLGLYGKPWLLEKYGTPKTK